MKNKDIRRDRIRKDFIDATVQIIENEGIDNVTIRKIADIAGYNSATIYNYFGDLSHLLFFAAMRFVKNYTDDLPNYIERAQDPLDEYLQIWRCFCKHSFKNPKIYGAIFGANLSSVSCDTLDSYYRFFPEDLVKIPDALLPMLKEPNLIKRSEISLMRCVENGYFKPENVPEINELIVLIYLGMLSTFINNTSRYSIEEATEKVVSYIRMIILHADELLLTSRP